MGFRAANSQLEVLDTIRSIQSHILCVLLLLTVYRQCGYTPACSGLLYAHPLDVELHVLLGTALDLLLHFPHHCLHVYDAFFGDAGGESQEGGV